MSDGDPVNASEHRKDSDLPETLLAELERHAEGTGSSLLDGCSVLAEEHQRCLEIIEGLALPIRAAIIDDSVPPRLQEYGELEEIGRGGMGIVYRAVHHKTQRVDAIKIIRPDRLACDAAAVSEQLQLRFEREARLAARVSHEQIVPVYQVGEVNGCLWFSMQFVDGCSLHELLRRKQCSLELGITILERISRAVDVVHRHGILHGDIKPQNILVDRETQRPMLTDFGLAEFMHGSEHGVNELRNGVTGTLAYMAPELVTAAQENKSAEEVAAIRSIASDIYSLGATLFSVLKACSVDTGQEPEARPTTIVSGHASRFATERFAKMPAELARICKRCVSEDPNARYATACELANDLGHWLERPCWNQFFPGLRYLLWMVVAPSLGLSGLFVWLLLQVDSPEFFVWMAMFLGYFALFSAFLVAQRNHRDSNRARRELWGIWVGHMVSSIACMICLRMLTADLQLAVAFFYPCCAAISAGAFFAKSGNFWPAYRWIGVLWAIASVLFAMMPKYSSILFGSLAVLTCVTIARCDKSFFDE
ncbi:MAG: serine/threonine-protein kinase [Pirellulaceae bacterium]|nr:serine/threonine-protein kinase [Pirellulaceae bacterium]